MTLQFASQSPKSQPLTAFTLACRQLWSRYRYLLISLLMCLTVIAVLGWFYLLRPLGAVYAEARFLQNSPGFSSASLSSMDFKLVAQTVQTADEHLAKMQKEMAYLAWLKVFPWVGENINAVNDVVAINRSLVTELENFIALLDPILGEATQLSNGQETEGSSLIGDTVAGDFGSRVLSVMGELQSQADQLDAALKIAMVKLDAISASSVHSSLRQTAAQLSGTLRSAGGNIENLKELLGVLPRLLSAGEETQYLIAIQNNTELRAAGGFWGNYGVLSVQDGKLGDIEIDDIYNIDTDTKAARYGYPIPYPLGGYLSQTYLHLRDTNFWPDIPTSSELMLDYFQFLTGRDLDGVIFIDPFVIENVLSILGPIEVPEYRITVDASNVTYQIQYQVHRNVKSMATRKDFVGILGEKILGRVLTTGGAELRQLLQVMVTDLDEKHLQLYATDTQVQRFFCRMKWCSQVLPTAGDFLMLAETNIGINKANFFVSRAADYEVWEEEDAYRAKLTVNYTNTSGWGWPGGPYTAYVRTYVPEGAELIKVTGAYEAARVSKEFGDSAKVKTVIGAIIRVNVESEQALTIEYRYPKTAPVAAGYHLDWQKQPGTPTLPGQRDQKGDAINITLHLDRDHQLKPAAGSSCIPVEDGWFCEAALDRDVVIELLP